MNARPVVSVVVPLFNEESVFPALVKRLTRVLDGARFPIEVVLVDDGSRDLTPVLMQEVAFRDPRFTSVFLSRNFGHQIAVAAGMQHAGGSEAVMIIDGDLQDPPELLDAFYEHIRSGYEVVYAVRRKRKENVTKRAAYWLFYRLLNAISEVDLPLDSGDFCMLSRRVTDIIVSMPEQSRFVRGMRTWVGFRQLAVEYDRDRRASGEPKYGFRALCRLAYDGIFNFSYVPLRLITKLGFLSFSVAFLYLLNVVFKRLMGAPMPSGFAALIFAIVLFSGVQLISLGLIGEYVARIYLQVKNRPLFVIKGSIVSGVPSGLAGDMRTPGSEYLRAVTASDTRLSS